MAGSLPACRKPPHAPTKRGFILTPPHHPQPGVPKPGGQMGSHVLPVVFPLLGRGLQAQHIPEVWEERCKAGFLQGHPGSPR